MVQFPVRRSRAAALSIWLFLFAKGAAQTQPGPAATRQTFLEKLVAAAIERTSHVVRYDPGYVHIPYPGGDVPADAGVCSDEIIRVYRAVGVDLQKEVHEDMVKDWDAYPPKTKWKQKHPDPSIDHRRVPNLMVFFERKGESLPISMRTEDYSPGDIVTWDLGGDVPHIGMVVNVKSTETGRLMIVHNIGAGPKMEDVLFAWKITGHYRYYGPGTSRFTISKNQRLMMRGRGHEIAVQGIPRTDPRGFAQDRIRASFLRSR